MTELDHTHDGAARSWVASAQHPHGDFPLQNLPFGVFRRRGTPEAFRGGIAIGDAILDLAAAQGAALFTGAAAAAAALCCAPTLNAFVQSGPDAWRALRHAVFALLAEGAAGQDKAAACLVPQADAEFAVPMAIGDYTDFFASIYHATNVGRIFRPEEPLLPNYKYVPVAYHGRSSTIAVGGHAFPRPRGQVLAGGASVPQLLPSQKLDYELELGFYVGRENAMGTPVPMDKAEGSIFGASLLNDWSARDIQAWEYRPLGPFLGKNFATVVSPWIVTMEALRPFRQAWSREAQEPQPLPYLESDANRRAGALDITVECWFETGEMRREAVAPVRLTRASTSTAYWTLGQLVAHHTVNGCSLRVGDLLGSGTLSGPLPGEVGSLIELSQGGQVPLSMPLGASRTFVEDGDAVILRGHCERPGARRIGFGECRSSVVANPLA